MTEQAHGSAAAAAITDRIPDEGDRIRVTYTSVYGGGRHGQTFTGTVRAVDPSIWSPDDPLNDEGIDAALYKIGIESDNNDEITQRRRWDATITRRLVVRYIAGDDEVSATVKGKNGARWHRLSQGNADWEINP